jgi:hypothetical protein
MRVKTHNLSRNFQFPYFPLAEIGTKTKKKKKKDF